MTREIIQGAVTISIPAPREGSDKQMYQSDTLKKYFNPRSPRGERRSESSAEWE